jgi:HNH endonuclease
MVTEGGSSSLTGECVDHGQKGSVYGYGTKRLPAEHGRVTTSAHRWAYCDHNGVSLSSIEGLDVMHSCHNHRCVNPTHLELGTRSQNQLDAQANGTGYSYFRDGPRKRRHDKGQT